MKMRCGLAALSTFWTTAAVLAAMAFDAVNEHVHEGSPLGALLTEHLTLLVMIWSAIYFVFWICFDLALATPLRTMASELSRLGTGSFEPIKVLTRVREIGDVARAVNAMIDRMKRASPRHTADAMQDDVAALRAIACSLSPLAERQAKRIREVADDLQIELAALVQGGTGLTVATPPVPR